MPLTQTTWSSFMENPDREIRKSAYNKFYDAFDNHKNTIASLYAGSVQQDIYHLGLKHLPLGHSVCSEISQKVHFHFFPCMRDCFKHQFPFAPLQPPGVSGNVGYYWTYISWRFLTEWFLPIDSSWLCFLGNISTNILCVLTLFHKIQIQSLLKSSCCVALNLFFKGMVKSKSWLSLLTQYPMYKER